MPVEERGLALPGSSEFRKYVHAYSFMPPTTTAGFALWLLLWTIPFWLVKLSLPPFPLLLHYCISTVSEHTNKLGGEGKEFCRLWCHTSIFCLLRFESWSRDVIDLELPESEKGSSRTLLWKTLTIVLLRCLAYGYCNVWPWPISILSPSLSCGSWKLEAPCSL